MDPNAEEQLDYGDEEYVGSQKLQYQGGGAISALADDDGLGEDDEYDDLYNDVNVGEHFLQFQRSEAPAPSGNINNGVYQVQKADVLETRRDSGVPQGANIPGASMDSKFSTAKAQYPEQQKAGLPPARGSEVGAVNYGDASSVSEKGRVLGMMHNTQGQNMSFPGSLPAAQRSGTVPTNAPVNDVGQPVTSVNANPADIRGGPLMATNHAGSHVNSSRPTASENPTQAAADNGATMLFVGELHWWTTDVELENVLSQYGRVKEIKFFDERASGKSKGYCQVEFYDSVAAAACKEGMNGYMFNGRACVVAFASSQTLKQMGASYMSKNQSQNQPQSQGRRPLNDGAGRGGMNFQGGDSGRNYGRGGFGRGVLNRGPNSGGPIRGRGGFRGNNMAGNNVGGGSNGNGGGYGQGIAGPAFGGPAGGMMHPQSMLGGGFDPTFMGRGGGFGGFPGPGFPGMLPSFPAVNPMGISGVAPHVNPAFFGRGMAANGMGMMGSSGMEGHPAGMWTENNMSGWVGDEHDERIRESSYGGDDGASDYGYGEANNDKGMRPSSVVRERDRGSERDWSGNSERRHRDDREQERDRSDRDQRYRDERDGYRDHRQRERDMGAENDWDRGQSSSRPRSRSRAVQEDDHRSRSRDADYGKRRRLPSE